jgi:putative transcriptional regulator
MPGIGDPRFERAVILMCVHSADQAMGVTVNRPLEGVTLRSVMGKLGVGGAEAAPDQGVLSGGPVERERGFVLHTDDFETLDSTLPITAGISLTATREVLDALADVDRRPYRSRLVLGCAAWAPGQLEGELAQNVWLTAEAEPGIIFDDAHGTKWNRALARLGISPDRLSTAAGHA